MAIPQKQHLVKERTRRGFTLVEVMVAVLLVGLTLAGTLGLLSWMVRANAFSARMTEAMTMNQAKIDELQEQDFETLASGEEVVGQFARSWAISTWPGGKTIEVITTWSSLSGEEREARLITMLNDERYNLSHSL